MSHLGIPQGQRCWRANVLLPHICVEQGDALIQFTLTADGRVGHVEAVHASNPVFARASEAIVATFECRGQGHDVVVQVPFSYRVE